MPTTPFQASDANLVAAARAGDKQAFASLVDRYFGTVWSIAYARLGEAALADDLAQEVFLIAFLHLDSLCDARRFAGWLSQITQHRAIDWLREKQRSSKLVAMVPVDNLAGASASVEEPAMDKEEQRQAVRSAVFALPPQQREIVLLKFAEGLNQAEIANRLEVHPATVGRQLEKALAMMRRSLQASVEDSLSRLRPSRQVAVRTAALVVAAAAMSASARAALISVAGSVPKLAAAAWTGGAATSVIGTLCTGASIMVSVKAASVVAAIVGVGFVGVALYSQLSANAPATAPSSMPSQTVQSMEMTGYDQAILAARQECYPPQVCEFLLDETPKIAAKLDPAGSLNLMRQMTAVDHAGARWVAIVVRARNRGDNRLNLGFTSMTGPMAIISDTGELIPIDRERDEQADRPGSRRGRYRVSALVTEPWPIGTQKSFCWIGQWSANESPLKPAQDGTYSLTLLNYPGNNCVQQLIFVATKDWQVQSSSEPPAEVRTVGEFTIHVWQKQVSAGGGYKVDLKLRRAEPKPGQ